MAIPQAFIRTPVVASLRDFLARPGVRHALLIGPPGAGKTTALGYLASALRADNHLVVMVRLRGIDMGDQLVVSIARALLDQTSDQTEPLAFDALDQIRAQFQEQFTASQRLSRAAEVLERIIQLVIERVGLKTGAYIFLDGLDEAYRSGDIVLAIEDLAESLRATSLVVTSRNSPVVDRLSTRTAFDTFNLAPLTQAESMDLIRRLLPERPLGDATLEQLISRGYGSPLVLNLFATYLRDHDDIQFFGESYPIRTLLDRFYSRFLQPDQAGMDARLLLSLLALFQPVSTSRLIEISGLPAERAHAALAKLSSSSVVTSSDNQVTFAHILFTEYHLENKLITHNIDVKRFPVWR